MPEAELIYDQYKDLVFGYLIRLCHDRDLAEDLTQETFYAALKQWDTFEKRSETGTWLCSIARNQYFLLLRKAGRQRKMLEKQQTATAEEDFTEKLMDRITAFDAYKALHQLKEPYREILTLRLFSELGYREIGELFEKSEEWARVMCFRAKRMIVEKMREETTHES